jgi:hypothetical protein
MVHDETASLWSVRKLVSKSYTSYGTANIPQNGDVSLANYGLLIKPLKKPHHCLHDNF